VSSVNCSVRDRGYYAPQKLGKTRRLTPEGYLLCEGVNIARIGEQLYRSEDINTEPDAVVKILGDSDGNIRVKRTPEEVFHPDTIASFEGKPVTVQHPNEFVGPLNHNKLSVGTVQNVRRGAGIDDDFLIADLLITAADAIAYVNSELPELSAGYHADYEPQEMGQAVQRNIRGNHVALVERGRAGPRVSIKDSSIGDFPMSKKSVAKAVLIALGISTGDADKAAVAIEAADGADASAASTVTNDSITAAVAAALAPVTARITAIEQRDSERVAKEEKDRKEKEAADAKVASDKAAADKVAADAEAERKRKEACGDEDPDEAVGDTILEPEGPGMVINLGKVYTGDSAVKVDGFVEVTSRAEVLAPGIVLPTKDSLKGKKGALMATFMRDALTRCYTRDAVGKDIVGTFLMGRKVADLKGSDLLAAFNGASNLSRVRNNSVSTGMIRGTRTGDFSKPPTNADLNKKAREFWAKQSAT
jgi:hypothetical protein